MATGDRADIAARLKARLPNGWFTGPTPVLDALLQGAGWVLAQTYALYAYAVLQARIRTATGGWLDLIAYDYFGPGLPRFPGQTDASYRALIIASIFRKRSTRAAIIKVLQDITGKTPLVIEPQRPIDTGAWDSPYGYWDIPTIGGGAWGGVLPYGFFVIAYRPTALSQWDGVTDADIYAAVNAVRAAGYTAWVQIQN